MLVREILLGILGLSAGALIAGGLFAFISELGVISDFADRTHTGEYVMLYEDAVMLGGVLGNVWIIFQIHLPHIWLILAGIGLFAGIFTGCWAMALAEMLDIFPIFVRRTGLIEGIPWAILGVALGRGVGSLIFFYKGWGNG